MNSERMTGLVERAAVYAALGDPVRLRIVDILSLGDASPSELMVVLDIPSNLLAHHLKALRECGIVTGRRSQGDGRKQYLTLSHDVLAAATPTPVAPARIVFVCTANSARSHLAAALWRRSSDVPAVSAGTHPADRIEPGAIDTAVRHGLPLPRVKPRALADVVQNGDLVVTVCDLAHEELAVPNELHWSVPDPVRVGTPAAFDAAYDEIESRVTALASRLAS